MNDSDNFPLSSILPINQLTFYHFIDDSACVFVVAHPTSRCFHVLFVSRKQLQYAALDAHCLLQLALLGFTGTVDLESEGNERMNIVVVEREATVHFHSCVSKYICYTLICIHILLIFAKHFLITCQKQNIGTAQSICTH